MSKPMNIRDEAVEAAAKAFVEVDPLWPDGAWEGMSDDLRENARGMVGAILEAAAPHLMAPRTVDTVEELDSLPEGTIVKNEYQFYQLEASRHGIAWWVIFNEQHYFRSEDIELPAEVIYET